MPEQVLVKSLTALCDGQCHGEVTLVTDDATEAYGVTMVWPSSKYNQSEAVGVARNSDGSIAVSCGAFNPDSEDRCDGSVTFSREALDETPFAPHPASPYLQPMESGD